MRPLSGKTESGKCIYNGEMNRYEYTKSIEKNTEIGMWKINDIYVSDQFGNEQYLYSRDYDMSAADFAVTEVAAEYEAPIIELSTLKVSTKEATVGDVVTILIKITDESAIKRAYVTLKNPITGGLEYPDLKYNEKTGYYECTKKLIKIHKVVFGLLHQ